MVRLRRNGPETATSEESKAKTDSSSVEVFGTLEPSSTFQETVIAQVRSAFKEGAKPELSQEGTSGAYLLRAPEQESSAYSARPVAVFKPIDEEPFAPNNPRGMQAKFGSETCRPGVKSGETTLREVIAYLLDHEGFSGVPETTLVEINHETFEGKPLNSDQIRSPSFKNLISGMIKFERSPRS